MTKTEMSASAYDMIYLVACAIKGIMPEAKNINLDNLYAVSKFHSLTAICAIALESAGITLSREWHEAKAKAIRKNILLDAERAQILGFFEQNGIWYMPLKGIILKDMYPKTGMRQMADNDILYDSSFQMQVKKYMESKGYKTESVGKGAHDTYHKPPVYNFELHTKLYSEQSDKVIHDYYSDVRSRLLKDSGNKCGYHFTDEDFYIFMTVHEYKHYSGSGTGLRSLLDCYIYLSSKGDSLDWEYIGGELDKLGIGKFERKSHFLAMKIFSSDGLPVLTEEEQKMLEYYLCSGTYGTRRQSIENSMDKLARRTGSKSKLRYIISRIFPDLNFYKANYPFFYRHKLLLPICWVYRLFKGLIINGGNIFSELKIVRNKKK